MSNIFNFCCVKDPEGVKDSLTKMEQMNGHFVPASCPFSGESESKVENQKQVKPNLRIKVPQPLRLKNHLLQEENFDTLQSRIGELSNFVSRFFSVLLNVLTAITLIFDQQYF